METKLQNSTGTTMTAEGGKTIPITLRDFFFHDPFFESWWPTFERIHQEVIKDSQLFWSKVKEDGQIVSSMLPNMKTEDLSAMIFPRRWMLPRFLSKEDSENLLPLSFLHLKHSNDHLFHIKEDENKLEVSMDIHDYQPDEIHVHALGFVLTVEAKHEEEKEGMYTESLFKRQYVLPEGCDARMVHSSLSADGILVVTAPKRQPIEVDGEVPISMGKKH